MAKYNKIVLIDDNDTINFYNEDIVEETGLFNEIQIFDCGKDAIEYFKNTPSAEYPTLVLLDIKMPDYDGFEVLDEIEDLDGFEDLKISMLTTSQHKRDIEKHKRYTNIVDFIEKPLTEEKLLKLIKDHLD